MMEKQEQLLTGAAAKKICDQVLFHYGNDLKWKTLPFSLLELVGKSNLFSQQLLSLGILKLSITACTLDKTTILAFNIENEKNVEQQNQV